MVIGQIKADCGWIAAAAAGRCESPLDYIRREGLEETSDL